MPLSEQADRCLHIIGHSPHLDRLLFKIPKHIFGVPVEGITRLPDATGLEKITGVRIELQLFHRYCTAGNHGTVLLKKSEIVGMTGETDVFWI